MKTKIVQFIYGLKMGGAETLVKEYALGLDKSKFDVTVLCLYKYNSAYEQILKDHNIKVVYVFENAPAKSAFSRIKYIILRYLRVKNVLKKINPDVIHIHLLLNTYVRFARPRKGTVLFYMIHNEPNVIWNNANIMRKRDLIDVKWLVKKYEMRFIALHEDMRQEVNQMFDVNNTVILNNGIDFNRFIVNKSPESIKKSLNIPVDSFVVGHVGRFEKQKNHMFLINIFYEISKLKPNAFLLLVGSGSNEEGIRERIDELELTDKVKILKNRTDIPEIMSVMDRFLFPSLYEGLSVTMIEAQKMHIPCIVSDTISTYTDRTNLVKRLSLSESAEKWANAVMQFEVEDINEEGLREWDMKEVCRKLEDLYENNRLAED